MNRRIAAIVLALVLAPAATCFAGIDNAGTTAANFLSVGSGASALGMGGASLGYASDLSSASWNVAALGKFNDTQVLFSHAGLSQSSAQEWASVGGRFGARTHWGMSGLYQGDGSIAGRDVFGNSTGNFSTASTALGFSAAQAVNSNVVVGAGFKWVNEALGGINGMGVGFDAGVLVQSGRFGFGAALQNVGGKMNYAGQKYPMPANYGLGVSLSDPTHGLRVAVDLNFPAAYYSDARVGLEWRYKDWLALRSGYRKELGSEAGEPLGGPTFGMGAGANGFWFDYGYVVGATSGASEHRIGLTFKPAMMNFGGGSAVGDASPAPAAKPAAASAEKPKKKSATESNATAANQVDEKAAKTSGSDEAKAAPNAASATIVMPTPDSATQRPATPGAKWYEKSAKKSGSDVAKAAPTAAPATIVMPTLDSAPPRETAPKGAMSVGIPITSIPIAPSARPMPPTAPVVATAKPVTPAAPVATSSAPPTSSTATAAKPVAPPSPTATTAKPVTPMSAPMTVKSATTATPNGAVAMQVATPKPAATSATTPSASAPVTKPETVNAPPTTAPAQTATPTATTPAAPASATPVSPTPAPSAAQTSTGASATSSGPVAVLEPPAPSTPTPAKPAVAAPATPTKPAVAASEAKPQAPPAPRPDKAMVKKGQTLADFAKEWGTTPAAIMMENNLVTDRVKPGTTLKLPKK